MAKRGNCFYDTAMKIVEKRITGIYAGKTVTLVHGTPVGRGPENNEIRYPHAWLEIESDVPGLEPVVWDPNVDAEFPKSYYYMAGNIDTENMVRYTEAEAREKMLETEHTGPWDDYLYNLNEELLNG